MPQPEHRVFLGMTLVVASETMLRLMELVEKIARTQAAVLITGETGSGKEIVARAVHDYSLRASQAFVDVNCGALPEHLIESELFGHEKGAFSGADAAKPGLFEMAHKGTLFLDEVGELDLRAQVKLLRVLDGVPYYRLGGQKKVAVDTRIVAATNQDLEEAAHAGRFRRDLYHRLNQCSILVPPLRERRDDVVPIAEHLLRQTVPHGTFSLEARAALRRHSWPGHVRELRNTVARAMVLAESHEIGVADLPHMDSAQIPLAPGQASLRLDHPEREAVLEALRKTGGHHPKTATLLGISRRTLSRKLKLYQPQLAERRITACLLGWKSFARRRAASRAAP